MLRKIHLFLDLVAHWWHRAASSRYVLTLEARVRQLEQDNAGLRDTVFGLRGLPPMPRGTPAAYSAPAAQPAAATEPQAPRPKVDPIPRKSMNTLVRERRLKQERLLDPRVELSRIKNELNEELERERREEAGKGFVVTDPGSDPVEVEEG